jgi:hypothetical protein
MNILQLYPKPHPQTAGRVIDNEAVLMLADDSEINVLNPVGSRIFELADGTHTVQQIADVIAAEFDVSINEATDDVAQFLQGLVGRNVLVLSDQNEG